MKCSVYKCDTKVFANEYKLAHIGKKVNNEPVLQVVCNFHYNHFKNLKGE